MISTDEKGFTLIEVLVAFVVLASAIVIGLEVHADGLRRLVSVENENKILALAQYKLANLTRSPLSNYESESGEADGFNWKIATSPINISNPHQTTFALGLASVMIFVWSKSTEQPEKPVLESILFTQNQTK